MGPRARSAYLIVSAITATAGWTMAAQAQTGAIVPRPVVSNPGFAGSSFSTAPSQEQPASLLQQPAAAPTLTFSHGQLTVHATNSSLRAILENYASVSGTKVTGVSKDERIFGVYGPGSPQEVLSSLLDDSGYNVVIAGRQPDGAPREVDLSLQTAGDQRPQPTSMTQAAEDDDDDDAPVSQPFTGFPPAPDGSEHQGPGAAPGPQQIKTPQQMLEELQRLRQQQEQQNANSNSNATTPL